LAPPLPAGR